MNRGLANEGRRALWAAVVLAAAAGSLAGRSVAVAEPDNAMATDADASTAAVDASLGRPLGMPFEVAISVTVAPTPYWGLEAALAYDAGKLRWIPTEDLSGDTIPESWRYMGLGGMSLTGTTTEQADGSLFGGLAFSSANMTTTATGQAIVVRFECVVEGSARLHLKSRGEAVLSSTTLASGGGTIPTTLADATIDCGGGAPGPTPTLGQAPTATPLPGATGTPPPPAATPTPLPPELEAVDLITGCNPVATTYPDGTPIETIAAAVGPADNLQALWEFEGGVWLGYSPAYPQASDLTEKGFLDVLFICIAGPGAFVRPVV